ncbi:hypothetical protein ABEB36_003275 [Hypothenemus hampei]|uniref:Uncharacterized protein n=1 Tax=Hypothenemus hampei TaxID=57062 RepID=A0ABD1FBS1_HYPHA
MACLTFIVIFALVSVSLANPVQTRWNTVHQNCQADKKTYVPDEIFEQLKRGEKPTLPANFGLHANCMLVQLDLQDEHGNVRLDGLRVAAGRQHTDSNHIDRIVNECAVNKESKETTAIGLFKCLSKNHVDIGQFLKKND